ncbi:ABC transporter permease [Anaerocolumna sp. AGMB13025]|uniref:ABC transporter permease n=1 Tax=Anaerocolumna sp. AGMB13025 TaxID=3039116 RepID=UPI00241C3C2E|nr:ABC transporter permease [Anaerocolumna sp. AGMB13025]WFR56705.1 ABC transporter permease [Anaerocolumna sp. AGMB13025]
MHNLLLSEFKKFKRKKIFFFGISAAIIFPLFNSVLLADSNFASIQSGVREDNAFLLLMPLLIILAASLFFLEQDNDTFKNLLSIPVSRNQLVLVKLLVLLIFSIVFQVMGFAVSTVIAVAQNIPLKNFAVQLLLTASTGVLMWAAALPCVVLVVWFNKSYILSVIIVFFYTLLNYVMHFSDAIMMQPLGMNAGTLMPVPMIFRWLYQFYIPEGEIQMEFYSRFSHYFVSAPVCFGVLLMEAAVCIFLMTRIYQRREI